MSFLKRPASPRVPANGQERRERLRAATRPAHRHLDDAVLAMVSRGRPGYAGYLAASLAARGGLEALALGHGAPASGFLVPVRDDLVRDLADIVDGDAPHPLDARAPGLPDAADEAGLWGISYVLAGSCLGAAHLMRRVSALGLSATFGARHLARQMDAARHWPRFVEALDSLRFTPSQEERCAAAASSAFAIFGTALDARGKA